MIKWLPCPFYYANGKSKGVFLSHFPPSDSTHTPVPAAISSQHKNVEANQTFNFKVEGHYLVTKFYSNYFFFSIIRNELKVAQNIGRSNSQSEAH